MPPTELTPHDARVCEAAEAWRECERLRKRLAEVEAERDDLKKIVWGVVHNARQTTDSDCRMMKAPRWAAVRDAIGCGSTQATRLCREYGVDPDEEVGQPCPDCMAAYEEASDVDD